MTVEKRESGSYFLYKLPVVQYDPFLAANRSLEWYVNERNRHLDRRKYFYTLTHRECILNVRIWQSEAECPKEREKILRRAGAELDKSKKNFQQLSEGNVPALLQSRMKREFESLCKEW